MIVNIEERINVLLAICQTANKTIKDWGSESQKAAEKTLWQAMRQLEEDAGIGVVPGKFVKFAVGKGYARYIIKSISGNRKHVSLIHLPYPTDDKSPAVNNKGQCDYDEVAGRVEFEDSLRKIMAKHIFNLSNGVIKPSSDCR